MLGEWYTPGEGRGGEVLLLPYFVRCRTTSPVPSAATFGDWATLREAPAGHFSLSCGPHIRVEIPLLQRKPVPLSTSRQSSLTPSGGPEYSRERAGRQLPSRCASRAREYRRFCSHLEPLSVAAKTVLHEPGRPVAHVYFPVSCLVSLLSPAETGAGGIEVAMLGRDGLVGMAAFFGAAPMHFRSVVQVSGEVLRAEAETVHGLVGRRSTLSGLLLRYGYALLTQLA